MLVKPNTLFTYTDTWKYDQKACRDSLHGFKGWNSQVHREFPRSFESAKLSRDNP